jgi:hypothetical protein
VVSRPEFARLGFILGNFILTWFLFISLYEIVYLQNDLISIKKEDNPTVRIENNYITKYPLFVPARSFWAIICFISLYLINPDRYLYLTMIPVLVCFVGLIHNSIAVKFRIGTFFLQRFGKNTIIAPLVIGSNSLLFYLAVMIIHPFIATINYTKNKNIISKVPKFLELYIAICLFLVLMPFHYKLSILFGYYGLYIIFWQITISSVKYGLVLINDREGSVLYHVHTNCSHDSDLTVEQLSAVFKGRKTVYITDHVEDLDIKKFKRLKEECLIYSRDGLSLEPGLEYSTQEGNHILALALKGFLVPNNQSTLVCINELRDYSDTLVWAHPSFSIRRLFGESDYRRELINIARKVDGIEFINLRPCRTLNHNIRSFLVGVISHAIFEKKCIVGIDLHNLKDIPEKYLNKKL